MLTTNTWADTCDDIICKSGNRPADTVTFPITFWDNIGDTDLNDDAFARYGPLGVGNDNETILFTSYIVEYESQPVWIPGKVLLLGSDLAGQVGITIKRIR